MATIENKKKPLPKASGAAKKISKPSGAKKPAESKPAEGEKEKKSSVGVIRDFDTIPPAVSTRVYEQTYKFGDIAPGKGIFVAVSGSTKDEKEAKANKIRSNMFAALYRYQKRNPESKSWEIAVRIIRNEKDEATEVGFYRGKGTRKPKESK